MPNFKDFDAMINEKVIGRPTFTLAGQKFTCKSAVPWKKYTGMLLGLGDNASDDSIESTKKFFKLVLVSEDKARFMELLDYEPDEDEDFDESKIVSNAQVGAILDWLMEYYTGKAKANDESSQDSPQSAGVPVKSASVHAKG